MDVAQDVVAVNETFYEALNRRDIAAMDVLWSRRQAVACIHPGWQALRTREEIMASWEAIMSNPQQPRIVAGGAEASVLDDVAIVVCREFVAGASLLATNVFAREEGRWRIVHHHSGPVAMVET
ncbi:MAG TPA: nuclear transport factor 2 family protein [Tepidiformaceae bacterium]|nr:nuclear transport factor 2 family protein [Tepidiformaceae bacterium]